MKSRQWYNRGAIDIQHLCTARFKHISRLGSYTFQPADVDIGRQKYALTDYKHSSLAPRDEY
ncbi:MAG: hypothetical protein MJA30_04545 [Cytophagales bacterium]|nr:hypothetical protein [Cytophagales bacterium]